MAGWKSVEEIDAYRMAVELRDHIIRFTETGRAARDLDFRDQIRRSSSSTTKNLAEGFERFYHGAFGYLAGVAKGSIGETIDALKEALAKGYLSESEFEHLHALAQKARKATSGLVRHWCRPKLRPNRARDPRRSYAAPVKVCDGSTEHQHRAPSTYFFIRSSTSPSLRISSP